MVDVERVLDDAGLTNPHVREYVEHWAGITGAERIEVVSAADDARLVQEALDAGELLPAGEGRYYSRSYHKDTARAEERTIVATSDEADAGVYNNWKPASEMKPLLIDLMTGASAGKTMYVIPYLMSPKGSPLERFAAGVELTDNRNVVLQMIRMARVDPKCINDVGDSFVRAVHVTGDLENLGQGTPDDKRYFVTVADERTILHFGSSYGGNALLGKIAHGLRQGSYDGWKNGFLVEQFMLLGITDKQTGEKYNICGGFPSASGKTNLAMTLAPDALGDRYHVEFYGDDIAWLWVGDDGKLYGMNPEYGVFGVAKDTNEKTNPTAIDSIAPGTGAIFTNVAYNEKTQEVWWEGRGPKPTEADADFDGWLDWKGERIADRSAEDADAPWAHPNSRFTTQLANVPNVAEAFEDPAGVEIHGIIFGGRTRDREPLIRAIDDVAEGVYDGLTLGAEATAAADGLEGVLRYDPMSMRPFMSYPEGDYAAHWLKVIGAVTEKPVFAHVNWFQRGDDNRFLWPGYRENLRPLVWLMQYKTGEVEGVRTPVGVLPKKEELLLDGLDEQALADLDTVLTIDVERWQEEIGHREKHLAQFDRLPEEIWEAHRRVEKALDER
ncbi:phosphoenolpyruvate carboxykinase (GTP) [Nocardioides sp. TF02-7]|uniref:phosphoenolpyruvate carboxykinase (GTP) n=1 Tax=Nocardioides sp. TF02-7 TaxID=2917724 RepID=UPI001F058891|nr:phosphoenolpyruvate carboxykinase (GTP) [Nocardioides sp. TF02-7]UMG94437.1 phosphoenolpyruvate carboxykinase (GTP) [Nocardioides sp. TF02-7]